MQSHPQLSLHYVVQHAGKIIVFDMKNISDSGTVFIDLTNKTVWTGERGLLGLAFHPDFTQNRYFYTYRTQNIGTQLHSVITRYTADSSFRSADINTELLLLNFSQPFQTHKAGQMIFGQDGFLYISSGDGGGNRANDNPAQDFTSLLGTILRIDVDNPSNGKNYGIPQTNPFLNDASVRPEIWAIGFRNPWRMSFDSVTGKLWLGDVGDQNWEEIDIAYPGKNYGWRVMEGDSCYDPNNLNITSCNETLYEHPVYQYDHLAGICIVGGRVYRGSGVPDLYGKYIYADYGFGEFWTLSITPPYESTLIANTPYRPSSFGVDRCGELYALDYQTGYIYKFQGNGTIDPKCAYYPNVTAEISDESTSIIQQRSNLIAVYVVVPIIIVIILVFVIFFILLKTKKLPKVLNKYRERRIRSMEMSSEGGESLDLHKPSQRQNASTHNTKVVEDLHIKNILGEGSFGTVYLAIWHMAPVAAKKLKGKAEYEAFLKEASMMDSLSHPNVVQYLGVFTSPEGDKYIVTEYMNCGSLLDLLVKHDLRLSQKRDISLQCCKAMVHLEKKNCIHRDIAARNFLVHKPSGSENYSVKLSDFGMARHMLSDSSYKSSGNFPVRWAAIEVLTENEYSVKSDVWSFGVLLWEIFNNGVIPYPNLNFPQVISAVSSGQRLEQRNCPPNTFLLMLRCWDADPQTRPSFEQLYRLLQGSDEIDEEKPFVAEKKPVEYAVVVEATQYQELSNQTTTNYANP